MIRTTTAWLGGLVAAAAAISVGVTSAGCERGGDDDGTTTKDGGGAIDAGGGGEGAQDASCAVPTHGVVDVTTGERFACALRDADRRVWCWGANDMGELGSAPSASDACVGAPPGVHCHEVPQPIPRLAAVKQLALGYEFGCALADDAAVWCWGRNRFGELGHAPGTNGDGVCVSPDSFDTQLNGDSDVACNPTPTRVPLPDGVRVEQIAAGWGTVCARTRPTGACDGKGGDLYCWGWNDRLQAGQPRGAGWVVPPSKVDAFTGTVIDVASALASRQTCALRDDGTVWCWGDDTYGRAGAPPADTAACPGTVGPRCLPSPIEVRVRVADAGVDETAPDAGTDVGVGAPLTHVVAIRVASGAACALRDDHSVWCWGSDALAALADQGPFDVAWHPGARAVEGLPAIDALSYHLATAYAVDHGGRVWAWGQNTWGAIGDGTHGGDVQCPNHSDGGVCVVPPRIVPALGAMRVVSAGGWFAAGLAHDGTVWAWGRNDFAQLGHVPGADGDARCAEEREGAPREESPCNGTPSRVLFP